MFQGNGNEVQFSGARGRRMGKKPMNVFWKSAATGRKNKKRGRGGEKKNPVGKHPKK